MDYTFLLKSLDEEKHGVCDIHNIVYMHLVTLNEVNISLSSTIMKIE